MMQYVHEMCTKLKIFDHQQYPMTGNYHIGHFTKSLKHAYLCTISLLIIQLPSITPYFVHNFHGMVLVIADDLPNFPAI